MEKMTCETCKYWLPNTNQQKSDWPKDEGFEQCTRIKHRENGGLSRIERENFLFGPELHIDPVEKAFLTDASDFKAHMHTVADFGCTLFESTLVEQEWFLGEVRETPCPKCGNETMYFDQLEAGTPSWWRCNTCDYEEEARA